MMLFLATMLAAQESYKGSYKLSAPAVESVARNTSEETVWRYSVIARDGSVATEIRRAMPYDVAAPEPLVFENGRVLLLHSFDAYGELFDRTGDLIKRIRLVDVPTPDYERTVRSAIHASQAIIGITLEGERVRIVSIDDEGNLAERRTIEGMNLTGVAVADAPAQVAVGTMSWKGGSPSYSTTFFEEDAEWSVPKGFSKGMFLPDGRFVGTDDRGVYVATLAGHEVDWSEEMPEGRMLVDAAVTENGISLLSADKPAFSDGTWVYTAPRLRTWDLAGKTVNETALRQTHFSKALLRPAGGRVVVEVDGEKVEVN